MADRRDPVLVKLAEADPAPDELTVPTGVMDAASVLDLVEERIGPTSPTRERVITRHGQWWRSPVLAVAAMVAVLVSVGVVALLVRSSDETAAVSCPADATPNVAGPESQAGPGQSPAVNQGAVFDVSTGRIMYVDRDGATWSFDVCTNTWQQAHSPIGVFDAYAAGDLVYDIDSERTIGLDPVSGVNIFDASSGTWTREDSPGAGYARGAVYDPVSGLVVVAFHRGSGDLLLGGYDTDTGEWSELGTIENVWGDSWMFLVGYSAETDEFVLHGGYAPEPGDPLDTRYSGAGPITVLYNLRNDTTAEVPGGPNLFSAWGVWYPYATGVDGAVIPSASGIPPSSGVAGGYDRLCRLDAATRTWDCLLDAADAPFGRVTGASQMVYDPINDRLVVIYARSQVWAVDLDTGRWTELV